MNPFKAIARGVTAPARWVRETRQVLRARDRAVDVVNHLEAAAANARLYRSATWWGELAVLVMELLIVLPIAPEVRVKAQGLLLKSLMVLGTLGGIAGAAVDKGYIDMLPAKYGAPVGLVLGGIATLAAYLSKSPFTQKLIEDAAKAAVEQHKAEAEAAAAAAK